LPPLSSFTQPAKERACPPAALAALATHRFPILRQSSYSATEAESAITRLADRIAMGEALLQAPTDQEILAELLAELDIAPESQVLVFSRTSAQNARISLEAGGAETA
jgi:hypothetical protein